MATGYLSKNDEKLPCFALGDQKVFLVSYEKYGTLSIHVYLIAKLKNPNLLNSLKLVAIVTQV